VLLVLLMLVLELVLVELALPVLVEPLGWALELIPTWLRVNHSYHETFTGWANSRSKNTWARSL
jgi:hypothetical protein